MSLIIKRLAATIFTIDIDENTILYQSLQGEDKIVSRFKYASLLVLQLGDYTEFNGRTYKINKLPDISKTSPAQFNYNITFEGEIYDLNDASMRDTGVSDFNYYGTAEDHIDKIVSNINRITSGWTTGTVATTEKINLQYNGDTTRTALTKIADLFDLEFSILGKAISLIQSVGSSTGLVFEYGRGNGLFSLDRKNFDSGNIITRLYGMGSTKNIDYNYGQKRLGFSAEYLDNNIATYGIKEGEIIFDDIFPQRTGTVSAIDSNILIFRDSGIDFNINDQLIEGEVAKVVFKTGNLAGYEFEIQQYTESTDELLLIQFKDADGTLLPNTTNDIQVGDTYTLVNIKMPSSYIATAETALESATQAELLKQSVPRVLYGLNFDWRKLKSDVTTLEAGDFVHVTDSDLGVDDDIRITGIEFPIVSIYKVKANVSNYVPHTGRERQIIETANNTTEIGNVDITASEGNRINATQLKQVPLYQGEYDAAKIYYGTASRLDIVLYSGDYYVAKNRLGTFFNILPTDTAYWAPFQFALDSVATGLLFAALAYIDNLGVRYLTTATTGQRVVIDALTNDIRFYDSSGNIARVGTDVFQTGYNGIEIDGPDATIWMHGNTRVLCDYNNGVGTVQAGVINGGGLQGRQIFMGTSADTSFGSGTIFVRKSDGKLVFIDSALVSHDLY